MYTDDRRFGKSDMVNTINNSGNNPGMKSGFTVNGMACMRKNTDSLDGYLVFQRGGVMKETPAQYRKTHADKNFMES